MPKVQGVLETAVYVEDLERSKDFYTSLFGWEVMLEDARFCAFRVSQGHVFLLFRKSATLEPIAIAGGVIPAHDGEGQLHVAFAIAAADLDSWEKHLGQKGIAIESRVTWPRGGRSIYFRDPDGHLLELATPGVWANY